MNIDRATEYIREQSPYEYRAPRYSEVARELFDSEPSLTDTDTLYDLGAGWTDFDFYLRATQAWRGRYFPIDRGLDGTDLNTWQPPQVAQWAVAIETLEHLDTIKHVRRLIIDMQASCTKGIVVTVPDPDKVDVLAQCDDHKTVVSRDNLEALGFTVRQWDRTLIATWLKNSSEVADR